MKKYQDAIVEATKKLVSIPSVLEEGSTYPFGESINKALDTALEIMKELGFSTKKADDHMYGYAEIGEGDMLGVLGHLDVVNARFEDGWDTDPFTPTEKDGYLYGRGTQDDKGPMMAAAYALKSLLDEGHQLTMRVRFIFGLDEENLWRSIAAYTEREEAPSMGFTPDSGFPLTYAEKGLLQILIQDPTPSVYDFQGGDSFNAVSSYATCAYDKKIEDALISLGYDYKKEGDTLTATGITAHAKNPWKGVSANLHLLHGLQQAGYTSSVIDFVCNHLNEKFRFEGFSQKDLSDFSGPLSINLGKMKGDSTGTTLSIDMRLPATMDKEVPFTLLRKVTDPMGLVVEAYDWLRPIHVPQDTEFIQNLLSSYREITGDTQSQPMISAGATYARAFDHCVAFGANFPGAPTSEHQPNERISLDALIKSAEIYRLAFYKCVCKK